MIKQSWQFGRISVRVLRTCHEPALFGALFGWKCHEQVQWTCHETADAWHFDGNPEHGSPSTFHDTFMADSWRFPGAFPFGHVRICHGKCLTILKFERKRHKDGTDVVNYDNLSFRKRPWKCHESAKPTCQIDGEFIANSWHFLSVPVNQSHVRIMALPW